MKKNLLCLFAIFCFSYAYADTVNINWGADNQLYTTTTCDIGTDVILPTPPTKRGHTFRGWKKDSFNRGTWPDWDTVPNIENQYLSDVYGNTIPMANDYIVVEDASGYTPDMTKSIIVSKSNSEHYIIINGVSVGAPNQIRTYTLDGVTYTVENTGGGRVISLYADKNVKYNGRIIPAGSPIIATTYSGGEIPKRNLYYSDSDPLNGKWKCVYKGIWAENNESGWMPVEQIVNE